MSSRSEDRAGARRGHLWRRLLKWGLGILAALIILAAILVGLFRIAANLVPRYHDEIAQQVGAQLGAPVELGRISLAWHGWGPEIRFNRVQVRDAQTGRVVLSARRLSLDFSLFSLLHGTQARPSGIGLDRPRVTLQETATGDFGVPGLSFGGHGGEGLAAMLGDNIRIEDGTLVVQFADTSRTSWTFTPVNLRVGGGETHAIRLALGLPEPLGAGSLKVVGKLLTRKPSPAEWQWSGSYALDKLLLSPLDRFLPASWPQFAGSLAFDGEARGTGTVLEQASGRVMARDLAAGESRLSRLRTHFAIAGGADLRVTLSDTRLLAPGFDWKPGKSFFARTADGRLQAGVARIDLAALPALGGFLPGTLAALDKRLHEMRPTGAILDANLAFTPGRIASLALAAKFADVGVYAAEGAPGFDHLAGEVSLNNGMGIFMLDAPGFTLRMPHVFPHTVPLDRVVGPIGIAITDSDFRIAMPKLSLTGPAGLDGTIMAAIDVPREGHVTLQLAASAAAVDVNPARALYMPTLLMPKPLADWLMHQLHGGRVSAAGMRLTGEAMRFPFQHGGGHFAVDFRFRGTTLAPGPDWQPLEDLGGSVHFENAGMQGDVTGGSIVHAKVVKAHVAIADFFQPQLEVTAQVAGTLPDFVTFLRASPIGGGTKSAFAGFETDGAARTNVTIRLPIMHPARFTLAGKFMLDDAGLSYAGFPYALDRVVGTMSYDGDGPTGGQLKGVLLDTPVRIAFSREEPAAGSDAKRLLVALDGRFPLSVLSKAAKLDLDRYASGNLPLHVELALPLAAQMLPLDVSLFSDLDGLTLKLPEPAGKSAIARRPFAARLHIGAGALDLTARYADVASVCAAIDDSATPPVVRRGVVMLGAGACKTPPSGYWVRGGWRELDMEPWLNELPATSRGTAASSPWPLETLGVDVRFGDIRVLGQQLKDQTIRGALGPAQMKVLLDGPNLAGRALIPRKPDNENPILVELTRGHFALPSKSVLAKAPASAADASAAASVTRAANAATARAAAPATIRAPAAITGTRALAETRRRHGLSPLDIPPFALHADRLELGQAELNDVTIVARRVPSGLLVKPIHVGGGALAFEGQLAWLDPPASGPQGAFEFVSRVNGLGKLLSGLGIGPVITGHGALSAGLAWREPRGGGGFASGLLGTVSTDLRRGSISEVSPGAGRLLSLLSLVNIPRYLVFNFHNLFGAGFPYSRIHGDYDIKNGIAKTSGLDIDSSIADIKITGSINLVQGTLDQKAVVEPNYFGSLPIIGAIVGGLGVGAAIYVLTKIFGSPLAAASRMDYSITGPIGNPTVTKAGTAPQQKPATPPAAATAASGT